MNFIGREKELSKLNELYYSEKGSLAIIYGRRRVGKTFLLRKFAENKNTLWFTAFEGNASMLLTSLNEAISRFFYEGNSESLSFSNIKSVMDFIFREARRRHFAFIIDEYPYLAEVFPEVSSIIQMLLDTNKTDGKLMLILSGSSMHFMEHQVLGVESPLYGRRDMSLKIRPFSIRETAMMLSDKYGMEDIYKIWAITGGVPLYINIFMRYRSVLGCISEEFFSDDGYFTVEAENIFRMEFRDSRNYFGVCKMIAIGCNKTTVIADRLGLSTANVSAILNNLAEIDIVEQKISVKPASRRPIWKLKDPLLCFWFTFCYMINSTSKTIYLNANLPAFLGRRFEDLCTSLIPAIFPEDSFSEIGSWWGGNPKTKKEEEIDIVAHSYSGFSVYCECKYTGTPIGNEILNKLRERSFLVDSEPENIRKYILFSKSGFAEGLNKEADVKCIDLKVAYDLAIERL